MDDPVKAAEDAIIPYVNTHLPSPDDFVKFIADKYFKATFTVFDLMVSDYGEASVSAQDTELFRLRYEYMLDYLKTMRAKGFHLISVTLIYIRGNAGAEFKYQDLTGRYQTMQYIRGDSLADVISLDFLHDLKAIPQRQPSTGYHHVRSPSAQNR